MRFKYLTDHSNKTLVAINSKIMITTTFYSILLIGVLVIVLWPTTKLFEFISMGKAPILFFEIFGAVLVINSYVNLRCGRGEMSKNDYFSKLDRKKIITNEESNNFLSYGLPGFMGYTFLMLLPFMPFLIISVTISGLPLKIFFAGFMVLYSSSLLCRMFGFTIYLFFNKWSLFGYFLARTLIIIFFMSFAGPASIINPLILLYKMNSGTNDDGPLFTQYIISISCAILFFIIINFLIIRSRNKKGMKS